MTLCLVSSTMGTSDIFDLETNAQIGSLPGHADADSSASYSSDGKMIVTSSDDHLTEIWDAKTFREIKTLNLPRSEIWQAVFIHRGHLVGECTYKGELWVWDTATGKAILSIDNVHSRQIGSLAFSKDGTRLLSAGDDASLKTWDISTGVNVFEPLDSGNVEFGHVSFSDDGKKLDSGNQNGRITIRDSNNASARAAVPLRSLTVETEVLKLLKVIQQDIFPRRILPICWKHA